MSYTIIHVNTYCTLLVDPTGWEGANIPVLVELFRSVIEEFNYLVGVMSQRPIQILPDIDLGHPMSCKNGIIFLSARQNYWSQYVYQFAHEYCHYLIDGPMDGLLETTFWFEESICELASMVLLKKVTERWDSWVQPKNPAQISLKNFSPQNVKYLKDLLEKNPSINRPLSEWIDDNIVILSEPIYHREMYNQIATVLYDLFIIYPDLWKVIPFLYRPPKEEYTDFNSFITKILKSRIQIEIEHLPILIECLTGSA